MKCKICQTVLSKVAVPSYLGEIYHCDKCQKDFFYHQVVVVCPVCNKKTITEYRLMDNFNDRLTNEKCESCKED